MNNEQITVNFKNLSAEEREQLMTLVKKANTSKPEPWWKGTEFDIKNGERYFYIQGNGGMMETIYCDWQRDDERITLGNACKDKAYMEQRAREIRLDNWVHNFAEVVNEKWEPDWDNKNENKCWCYYDISNSKWFVCNTNWCKNQGTVYFKTKKLAQRCIDEIILPFERGEL